MLSEYVDESDSDATVHRRSGVARIVDGKLAGPDGKPTTLVHCGDAVTVQVEAELLQDLAKPVFGVSVASGSGVHVYSRTNRRQPGSPARAGSRIHCDVKLQLPLKRG